MLIMVLILNTIQMHLQNRDGFSTRYELMTPTPTQLNLAKIGGKKQNNDACRSH
jgi:hypothetical protein